MEQGRFQIRKLMTWVAVVAANLAVLRALYTTRQIDLLIGGLAFWVTLQIWVLLALRRQGPDRYRWLGLAVGGAIGSLVEIAARAFPSSIIGVTWKSYIFAADGLLRSDRALNILVGIFGNNWFDLVDVLIVVGMEFVPIFLLAWVGGVTARRILKRIA